MYALFLYCIFKARATCTSLRIRYFWKIYICTLSRVPTEVDKKVHGDLENGPRGTSSRAKSSPFERGPYLQSSCIYICAYATAFSCVLCFIYLSWGHTVAPATCIGAAALFENHVNGIARETEREHFSGKEKIPLQIYLCEHTYIRNMESLL